MRSDPTAFEGEVSPLMDELFLSANALDTDRHLALYWRSSALVFIANGAIIRGWDAYRDEQRKWWDDGQPTGVYSKLGDPVYEVLSADCGLTTLAMRALSDGKTREIVFTGLWRRRPEGWRIVYAHESSTR